MYCINLNFIVILLIIDDIIIVNLLNLLSLRCGLMEKNINNNYKQTKNSNDKFYEIYRYFESISQKQSSAFRELLDYTIKNNGSKKYK